MTKYEVLRIKRYTKSRGEEGGFRRMDKGLNLEKRGMGNTFGEEKWNKRQKEQGRKESRGFTFYN